MHGLLASAALENTLHASMQHQYLEAPHAGDYTPDLHQHYLARTAMLRPVAPTPRRDQENSSPPRWETVLITGASGYLGKTIAEWLVSDADASTNLVLASRSAIPDLCALSMRTHGFVQQIKMDVASDADWQHSLQGVNAVVHAAGVLDDATLPNATLQQARRVAAGKLGAMAHLNNLAAHQPIYNMLLFSSVSSLLGSPGQVRAAGSCAHILYCTHAVFLLSPFASQSIYAAVNGMMDAHAEHLHVAGTSCKSLQLGPWAGGGMASSSTAARAQRFGMHMLTPTEGLHNLATLLSMGDCRMPVAAVLRCDWDTYAHATQNKHTSAMLRELVSPLDAGSTTTHALVVLDKAPKLPLEDIHTAVREALVAAVGHAVPDDQPFGDAGAAHGDAYKCQHVFLPLFLPFVTFNTP